MFTDYYPQDEVESPSKKKWIAPIVVLLLCFTALTGVAYAYNSTMDATVNADTNSYELTLGDNVVKADCTGKIQFDSVRTSADDAFKYSVNADAKTATFTVTMVNNTNTSGFKLAASDITNIKVYSDAACTSAVTKITAAASVDNGDSATSHVVTLTFSGSNLAKTDIPAKLYVQMTIKTSGTAA